MWLTDRSRTILRQRCPRAYWWGYGIGGGIQKINRNLEMSVGIATHVGLRTLLEDKGVEKAVLAAKESYWKLAGDGFELGSDEDASYVYREQEALVEAMIRAYFYVGYPALLRDFEVLETEREELFELVPGIGWMARTDALLRDRAMGTLTILNYRTAKIWTSRTEAQNRHDMQGMSEIAAVDARLQGERVASVKMEFLLKGEREEYPRGCGIKRQNSPLIRPWRKLEDLGKTQWAWKYAWNDESGSHRLGKGWERVNIWEEVGVKEWIAYLASEMPEALEAQFVFPVEYFRDDQEVSSWKTQMIVQEMDYRVAVEAAESARTGPNLPFRSTSYFLILDQEFEQRRHSCDFPTTCQFQPICYGPRESWVNPMGLGIYEPREPNHAPEREIRGYV